MSDDDSRRGRCGRDPDDGAVSGRLQLVVLVACGLLAVAGFAVTTAWRDASPQALPDGITPGVVVRQEASPERVAALEERIASVSGRPMKGSGLAAVTGGAHLGVASQDAREVLLPVPQLAEGQAPVWYSLRSTPADAVVECRLRTRRGGNVVASAVVRGGEYDVRITWTAVVLLATPPAATGAAAAAGAGASGGRSAASWLAATCCVQADDEQIAALAARLWPAGGDARAYAAAIQQSIGQMTRQKQPRSLDAAAILASGENGICTGNANLAAALMRARGVPCRAVAVVPSTSQPLEMHRIVEFWQNGRWLPFDPSSVQPGVPTQSWQNVIMARTTSADEAVAMTPRPGSALGCPYGQEIELPDSGVTLAGQDFFWTTAKPLAEFEPSREAFRLAAVAWARCLASGVVSRHQLAAASATSSADLSRRLRHAGSGAQETDDPPGWDAGRGLSAVPGPAHGPHKPDEASPAG